MGQLYHVAVEIAPEIRGPLATVASFVDGKQAHFKHENEDFVLMPEYVVDMLHSAADRAYRSKGAAFVPRRGELGKNGRGCVYQWYDASKDEHHAAGAFRGWGAVTYVEHTGYVFITQDAFSCNAMATLDSTCLEQHAGSEALIVMGQLLSDLGADGVQIGDNSLAGWMSNFGGPKGLVLRSLVEQRWCIRDAMSSDNLVTAVSVVRARNWEADWLTKHVFRTDGDSSTAQNLFIDKLLCRFGHDIRIVLVPPPAGGHGRLVRALRMKAILTKNRAPLQMNPLPVWHNGAWVYP